MNFICGAHSGIEFNRSSSFWKHCPCLNLLDKASFFFFSQTQGLGTYELSPHFPTQEKGSVVSMGLKCYTCLHVSIVFPPCPDEDHREKLLKKAIKLTFLVPVTSIISGDRYFTTWVNKIRHLCLFGQVGARFSLPRQGFILMFHYHYDQTL